MSPEEQLDEARADQAWKEWVDGARFGGTRAFAAIAARLAREGWTPPEPVDPDVLAFREWAARRCGSGSTDWASAYRQGRLDHTDKAHAYLAGARMAREQERERANHPIAFAVRVMAGVFKDLGHAEREARTALAKYRGEA